jgi:hypothetical protein
MNENADALASTTTTTFRGSYGMRNDERVRAVAERGQYQVWHQSSDGYTPAALVSAGNLLAALVFTMSRRDAHWQEGEYVTALVPDARSTNIGDVIVSPEGVAYEIKTTNHGLVFDAIDFPPHREQMALFAEWTKDYAATRERDGKAAFGAILSGTSIPAPQSTSGNQRDREGELER